MKKKGIPRGITAAVDKLLSFEGDKGLIDLATQIKARLKKPMPDIIRRIPGKTMVAKAEAAGVSRQNLYAWQRGAYRPTWKQAEVIEKLTGIKAALITGRPDLEPVKPKRKAKRKPRPRKAPATEEPAAENVA